MAVELDDGLTDGLAATLRDCEQLSNVQATSTIEEADFVTWAVDRFGTALFGEASEPFDLAILNPPYRKLATCSRERRLLAELGIEATNLYAAFVACALRLLKPGGQLVAITPRSFCNGPYFRGFRRQLLEEGSLRRVHVFEHRHLAFKDHDVLQENVVVHLHKGPSAESETVTIEPAPAPAPTPSSAAAQADGRGRQSN